MTAALPLRPPDWTTDGLCLGVGAGARDLWHIKGQEERARAICATCPVRYDCALLALTETIDSGVWGGLTVQDRKVLAREYGFEPPGAPPHGSRARYVHRDSPCRPALTGRPCPSPFTCRDAHSRWAKERRANGAWVRSPDRSREVAPVTVTRVHRPVVLIRAQVRRAKATGRRRR
ncbi:Transcription factor WhiB [Klenkia soli]|uniref:Transcription factor WhiB n=1 Tax=Klenkia soli TaxID=1052260 RepID=A0A1H0C175_9ACTN|nr:Transcription factor WhiB [Klenkia soli]